MTVKELREYLEKCDQDIQVVVIDSCIKGIASVKQVKPISMHDELEYPNVVEIRTV